MHLLIDSDSLCYQAGFVANNPDQEALACWQVGQSVERIVQETGCFTYKLFLSGGENFRYKLYPEYKANRGDMKRPIHLQAMRAHLAANYPCMVTDGIEADDAVGIDNYAPFEDTIVMAHIDKDLDMFEGTHYNYNKKTWYSVSEWEATRHLYYQLIMGDKADNIPGFDGKMRQVVPKFLQWSIDVLDNCETEAEMFKHVFEMYGGDVARFSTSVHCLYLQKKENDEWSHPMGAPGFTQKDVLSRLKNQETADSGLKADLMPSSEAP